MKVLGRPIIIHWTHLLLHKHAIKGRREANDRRNEESIKMAGGETKRQGHSGGSRATSTAEGKCGEESVGRGTPGGEGPGRLAGNQGVYGGEDFLGFFVLPPVTLSPLSPNLPQLRREVPLGN